MAEHVKVVHTDCQQQDCMICDGGLFLCAVCGGFEGALLPECPGRELSVEEHQENYRRYCEERY